MRVCYFGIYDPAYCRNKNIIKGLRKRGVSVIEVRDTTRGPIKYWRLLQKYWSVRKEYDVMVVGFPGQIIVPFAKLLTRRPVVYDLHVSYYDSIIKERKEHPVKSFAAVKFYLMDWIACRMADRVLLDTKEHVRYVASLLHLPEKKFAVIYHGIDNELFAPPAERPVKGPEEKMIVSFHGYIQLLNGMELVIQAMRLLKDEPIMLWIIGGGPEYPKMQALARELQLSNVEFYSPMAPPDLAKKIANADVGLGFFSLSQKIDRVIANKVYELMALRVPVLTGTSIAMQEHFADREHVFYCQRGSADAIAKALRELRANASLRAHVADTAYQYVTHKTTFAQAADQLISVLASFSKR
jgi:glycosyltransferase involved in cell wall biosynthesis